MDRISRENSFIKPIIVGGALLCFACVACMISSGGCLSFDTAVREFIYNMRSPILNKIFIAITYMGNWQTITTLAVILLIIGKTRKNIAVPFAITSVASTVLYKLVKTVFKRERPELSARLIAQGGYSFPSGHSMNCIVCYGILIYLIRRYCKNKKTANALTAFLTVLIILIGFSRVYVGVHFPSDVIGGWSLGLAVLMIAILIIEKIRGKK